MPNQTKMRKKKPNSNEMEIQYSCIQIHPIIPLIKDKTFYQRMNNETLVKRTTACKSNYIYIYIFDEQTNTHTHSHTNKHIQLISVNQNHQHPR